MKALIINGGVSLKFKSINSSIERLLNSYFVESVFLEEKLIEPCRGCFACWISTPGVCMIKDEEEEIIDKMIKSDLVVFLTPVVFGGYSSLFKKFLDRIIPILLPYFKRVKGEYHHLKRYDKYPKVVVIGVCKEKNNEVEETFSKLIGRNSLNWHNTFRGGTINLCDDLNIQLSSLLKNEEDNYAN